jgi:hypothetical protein
MDLDKNSVLRVTTHYYSLISFGGVVQAMMSIRGYDIPLGRTTKDNALRQEVFDIIAPYVLSAEIRMVNETDPHNRNLWFETFTNSQKGVLFTSLNGLAKDYYRKNYFPDNGAYPPVEFASLLGLPSGMSFLVRYFVMFCNITY